MRDMSTDAPAAAPRPSDGQSVNVVYARLRGDILSGALTPGAELAQMRLAKELGVSRTPLREALRMLMREGLVEGEPNRSLRVTRLSLEDMDQHWASRIALETIAIRIAVPLLTVQDFAGFEGDLAQMDYLGEAGDFEAWDVAHRAFHQRMVKPAGEGIARALGELTDRAARYRSMSVFLGQPRTPLLRAGEHRLIVEACAARDPDGAAAAFAHHVAITAYALMALVDPAFEPVLLPTAVAVAQTPVTRRKRRANGSAS
jgi:DNA-binding GntR family transcriptional regulator